MNIFLIVLANAEGPPAEVVLMGFVLAGIGGLVFYGLIAMQEESFARKSQGGRTKTKPASSRKRKTETLQDPFQIDEPPSG